MHNQQQQTPEDDGLTGYLITLAFILSSSVACVVGLVMRASGK